MDPAVISFKDQKYDATKKELVAKGELFVDDKFPANAKTLFSDKEDEDIQWKRPKVGYEHDDVIKWNIFRVTGLCAGNSPVTGEFPAQEPVTQCFGVFFDLRLDKRLSKQSLGLWFETPLCLLWHHCNGINSSETLSYPTSLPPFQITSLLPCLIKIKQ